MILFSTFLYSMARDAGEHWRSVLAHEVERGPESQVPAIRTLAELNSFESSMNAISGPSRIAPARSSLAGVLLRSECDVWLTVDDDAYAPASTLQALVATARATRSIVSGACLQRDPARRPHEPGVCNVRFSNQGGPLGEPKIVTGEGFTAVEIYATGFGVVAIHKEAIERMVAHFPELTVEDEFTLEPYPALFLERLVDRRWQGEDMAFSFRARAAGVPMYAALDARVDHAGRSMVLELHKGELAMRLFDVP